MASCYDDIVQAVALVRTTSCKCGRPRDEASRDEAEGRGELRKTKLEV